MTPYTSKKRPYLVNRQKDKQKDKHNFYRREFHVQEGQRNGFRLAFKSNRCSLSSRWLKLPFSKFNSFFVWERYFFLWRCIIKRESYNFIFTSNSKKTFDFWFQHCNAFFLINSHTSYLILSKICFL